MLTIVKPSRKVSDGSSLSGWEGDWGQLSRVMKKFTGSPSSSIGKGFACGFFFPFFGFSLSCLFERGQAGRERNPGIGERESTCKGDGSLGNFGRGGVVGREKAAFGW